MTQAVLAPSLARRLAPLAHPNARRLALIVLGVGLLALLAQLRFAVGPVPITAQTLGVLLVGACYGARLGGATLASYLALGALGLPVFQGGSSGFGGPTAGYLVGFLAAALAVGWLAERGWDRRIARAALAMLVGNALLYLPGLLWLRLYAPDWPTTLAWGLTPFLVGDLLKLLLAALLLPAAWRLLGSRPRA